MCSRRISAPAAAGAGSHPHAAFALQWEEFDALRERVAREWGALPQTADVWSPSLRQLRAEVGARLRGKGGSAAQP